MANDKDIHLNQELEDRDKKDNCAFVWRDSGFDEDIKCHCKEPVAGLCEKIIA